MGSFAEDWRRCVRAPNDNSAWEDFLASHHRLLSGIVYRVACRFGVDNLDEVEDAIQEICLKISSQVCLDRVPDDDDGVLEMYMKALIANAAHDYFRGQRAKKRDLMASVSLDQDLPVSDRKANDLENEVLLRQLQCLAGGDARSQRVFQLYYRCGWTAKEIAKIAGVGLSAKGVESLIYRLTTDLRQKIQTPESVDSSPGGKETPPQST